MDFADWLTDLRTDPKMAGQIAHISEFARREAIFATERPRLHPRLEGKLEELGLDRLYSHQGRALEAALAGKDVVVVTGTASGKSLCYNLPALQSCLTEPMARALYLFPTKALAQDQVGKLEQMLPGLDVRVGTYDGDTPKTKRPALRKLAHILLSNPDMLHLGILPNHEQWTSFLKSLRVITIDEMHVYRGVFGSHVCGVLRRLLRLCEWHGSRPQIVACTATIGNPGELFVNLTGRQPVIVDEDGAPRGKRTFVFWNPPLVSEQERLSTNLVVSELVSGLAESKTKTLTFCRARRTVELVLKMARERLKRSGVANPSSVESYRAGYTVKERREIEQALFKGKLTGLVATNAMELGVDVGGLDAVVMNGYPGTIASFWQQVGRAGRAGRDGMAILVAHDDPLEQFLIREPHRILESKQEVVSVNPSNPQILTQQIRCAAFERPISPSELEGFGNSALDLAEALDRAGELSFRSGRFFYPHHESPAAVVNLRGAGGSPVLLMADDKELGSMEHWRALEWAHPGAVYLHRGATFVVEDLNLEARIANLVEQDVDFYTQPLVQSTIEVNADIAERKMGSSRGFLCGVRVTDLVIGFKRRALDGGHVLGVQDLDLPPESYDTVAIHIDMPELRDSDDIRQKIEGVHGLEHALLAVSPLLSGCDRGDLGSSWYALYPDTGRPAVFIFDRTPGGVGICESLFRDLPALGVAALQLLASCKCIEGCPSCLLSPRCSEANEGLSKAGAREALDSLLRT